MERTLSRNEARIVLDLEWRGQQTITLAELRDMLGASEGYARLLAHRLVAKGWLERLRPGLFQLVPAERGTEGVADTHPLTAGSALVDPYRSAMPFDGQLLRRLAVLKLWQVRDPVRPGRILRQASQRCLRLGRYPAPTSTATASSAT